ncbi:hypothetical protein ACC684_34845 [Rhizobium ruizarguesonis]|uniref:hypothetical protein n=1 Tax=Rhizobium ruizarguesonis TaxID=2081791 RepID=UPI0013BD9650|nr:hypothetical protein [Rhizobium ruizarguesonis]
MSDTDMPPLTKAPEMYVHYCEEEGRTEWSGWGNSPSPAVTTRWWCFAHFPHRSYGQEQALRRMIEAAERGNIIQ